MTKRRGPEPATLKIDGAWEASVERALSVPRPAEGWPEPPVKPAKATKKKPRAKK